jgi:2-C-methyl-D-erythritol 4-phosphate cytidylyltransferase
MGDSIPKQFHELAGRPIIIRTLQKLDLCPGVTDVLVAVPAEFMGQAEHILERWKIKKVRRVVPGGKERQDSVKNALDHLTEGADLVLIHDAVRPFVSVAKITECIETARRFGAAVLAVPSRNTIKEVRNKQVVRTLDRAVIWQVQTPQVFRKSWILDAYRETGEQALRATDDAALVEHLGHDVHVVEGEENNIKITEKGDMILALAMAEREDR